MRRYLTAPTGKRGVRFDKGGGGGGVLLVVRVVGGSGEDGDAHK